jgi:transcriptional regulator with XRE-family HTH domain
MDQIFATIRRRRQQMGLSQQQLATQCGLSLATIQGLERGSANPEYSTLLEVFSHLGVELIPVPKQIDWSQLIWLGAPLLPDKVQRKTKYKYPPNKDALIFALKTLAFQLDQLPAGTREHAAIAGLLSAIQDHYPTTWKQLPNDLKAWLTKNLSLPGNSHSVIKLRRLSLARLSEYL